MTRGQPGLAPEAARGRDQGPTCGAAGLRARPLPIDAIGVHGPGRARRIAHDVQEVQVCALIASQRVGVVEGSFGDPRQVGRDEYLVEHTSPISSH